MFKSLIQKVLFPSAGKVGAGGQTISDNGAVIGKLNGHDIFEYIVCEDGSKLYYAGRFSSDQIEVLKDGDVLMGAGGVELIYRTKHQLSEQEIANIPSLKGEGYEYL